MRTRHLLAASISVALIAGASLLAAPAASADQVWYQGVERASADAPCPASSADDLTAGWSEWTPSWAQWANGGRGGYVCTRTITWAHEDAGGAAGICIYLDTDGDQDIYILLPGVALTEGTRVPVFFDPGCTDRAIVDGHPASVPVPADVVWAPGGQAQAQERCTAAFGSGRVAEHPDDYPNGTWACVHLL